MSSSIHILIVEDEPDVLDALVRDMEVFEETFPLEVAATAGEARSVIKQITGEGGKIGLILCDHLLPGENGVDLLISLQDQAQTRNARKVLVTGHAKLEDTVKAVNEADLNHYIGKPWKKEELHHVVIQQLTDYVLENEKSFLPFMHILDSSRLADAMRKGSSVTDS